MAEERASDLVAFTYTGLDVSGAPAASDSARAGWASGEDGVGDGHAPGPSSPRPSAFCSADLHCSPAIIFYYINQTVHTSVCRFYTSFNLTLYHKVVYLY